MCVFKQGEIWWYEFTLNEHRIRKSSKTADRDLAKLIEAEHRRSLEDGTGGISPTYQALHAKEPAKPIQAPKAGTAPEQITRAMTLAEAGELWLTQKVWKRRKPKTLECCRCYLNTLVGFFGEMRLSEFHAGSLRAYQAARAKKAGPSSINHELNALAQILRLAKCWGGIADYYSPLQEPEWQKPKTFTFEEQQAIFSVASESSDFELAEIVFTITRHTSACGSELRLSRIRNLNLDSTPPTFQVTGDTTKNDIRPRLLPLDPAAEKAFRRALERANRLGAHRDDDFLFPLRVNRCTWDPTKPASRSWLRKQYVRLRELTGIKHLRPHAWRHQLCTEMLEQGVPVENVRGVMGWVSDRMVETYSHTRLAAKQEALGVIEKVGSPDGGAPAAKSALQGSRMPAPNETGPASPAVDLLNPLIQAEIARQVALALSRGPEQFHTPVIQHQTRSRLVQFPGPATNHA
jgi:integrase